MMLETNLTVHEKHQQQSTIRAIEVMLKNPDGRHVIKYLLKEFGVLEVAPSVLPEKSYFELTGLYSAGRSLFSLVTRANHVEAGLILAEIQKEKYDVSSKASTNESE